MLDPYVLVVPVGSTPVLWVFNNSGPVSKVFYIIVLCYHDSERSSECRQYLVLKLGGWWWGKAGCVVCVVWCKFALLAFG